MKPLSIALLCLFVMTPFLVMADIRCDAVTAAQTLRTHYDQILDTAVSDAAQQMALQYTRDAQAGTVVADGEPVSDLSVEAFFTAFCDGMGANTQTARERLRIHVPVIVVASRDSARLYMPRAVRSAEGKTACRHVCVNIMPYPYSYGMGDRTILFTTGTDIYMGDPLQGVGWTTHWQDAPVGERFADEATFEAARLRALRDTVACQLEMGLALAATSDVAGRFDLPAGRSAAFRNAVSDGGLFVFVEGLPVGSTESYQTFAFGGARVAAREPVVGWHSASAAWYCTEDCGELLARLGKGLIQPDDLRHFSNKEEAASEGFRPCPFCCP